MRKKVEMLLQQATWKVESLEKSLKAEMESMTYEASIGNVNYVKSTCERIEQIRRELTIYKSYQSELETILKMED